VASILIVSAQKKEDFKGLKEEEWAMLECSTYGKETLEILVEKLHCITYVQNLFNDADSNSHFIALSDRMITE
jgi:hypothetical protein